MNKEINDLNNVFHSLDSRMTKAESKRDSLTIALSNTPFPSGTCFDNTGYDNHRSVPLVASSIQVHSTTSIGFPLAACLEVGSTTKATQRNLKRRQSKDAQPGISHGSIRQQRSNHATSSERSPKDCPRH